MPFGPTTLLGNSDLLSKDKFNQYLFQPVADLITPPQAAYTKPSSDPSLTTTATSFAYIDNTLGNFYLQITSKGNPVMVGVRFEVQQTAGNSVFLELEIDGVAYGGSTSGLIFASMPAGTFAPLSFVEIVPLAAGVHNFRLMWRTNAATATLVSAVRPSWYVREL